MIRPPAGTSKPRPIRKDVVKDPGPHWRMPLSGYVTPRLQRPQEQPKPVVDAIGFQHITKDEDQ